MQRHRIAARARLRVGRRQRIGGRSTNPDAGKIKLAPFANAWLDSQTHLRPGTIALYRSHLDNHVLPKLGHLNLSEICEDDLVALINEMREGWNYRRDANDRMIRIQREGGYSPYTIKGALTPLGRMLNAAVRARQISSNPIRRLEPGERPSLGRHDMRVLSSEEIRSLLQNMDEKNKPLIATALFTGLRLGELLGLTWAEADLEAGLVRVRKQLDRNGQRVIPKSGRAIRDVELMPALVRLLAEHKVWASKTGHAKPVDFVFCSQVGTPLQHRNVARRMLNPAMEAAKLLGEGSPRFRFHDLRHTFASVLIAQGHDVVFVSRQLGHSSTRLTLDVYAHLFDKARHAQRMRDELEAAYGTLLGR